MAIPHLFVGQGKYHIKGPPQKHTAVARNQKLKSSKFFDDHLSRKEGEGGVAIPPIIY